MKKSLLAILTTFMIMGFSAVPGISYTITLSPTMDTWVHTYQPTTSWNTSDVLNVGRLSPNYYIYRSYL